MMKLKSTFVGLFLLASSLSHLMAELPPIGHLPTDPILVQTECGKVISAFMDWDLSSSNQNHHDRVVTYKMAMNKIASSDPNNYWGFGFVGFTEGRLMLQGSNFKSDAKMVFSDRYLDGLVQVQGFNAAKSDNVRLTLTKAGKASLTLLSWGGAVLNAENLVCTQNSLGAFITGTLKEGNGQSIMALTLHKSDVEVLY